MGGVMGAIDKLRGRGKKSTEQRKGDTGKQRKKAPFNKPDRLNIEEDNHLIK